MTMEKLIDAVHLLADAVISAGRGGTGVAIDRAVEAREILNGIMIPVPDPARPIEVTEAMVKAAWAAWASYPCGPTNADWKAAITAALAARDKS